MSTTISVIEKEIKSISNDVLKELANEVLVFEKEGFVKEDSELRKFQTKVAPNDPVSIHLLPMHIWREIAIRSLSQTKVNSNVVTVSYTGIADTIMPKNNEYLEHWKEELVTCPSLIPAIGEKVVFKATADKPQVTGIVSSISRTVDLETGEVNVSVRLKSVFLLETTRRG